MRDDLVRWWWVVACVVLVACGGSSGGDDEEHDVVDDQSPPDLVLNNDFFPYYEGSIWQYDVLVSGSRTGQLQFMVTAYDDATKTATLRVSRVDSAVSSIGEVLYLRKTARGIEYGTSPGHFMPTLFLDGSGSKDYMFMLCAKPAMPRSFLGSVVHQTKSGSITTEAGAFSAMFIDSSYNASGRDPYYYVDDASEYHNIDVGFVYSSVRWADHEMGYPNIISGNRTVSLKGYRIHLPDGSLREGGSLIDGSTAPAPPVALVGTRETPSSVVLTWSDGALNETSFEVERRRPEGSFERIATLEMDSVSFTDSGLEESQGYFYRVRALNGVGASAYSDEVFVNIFGVPRVLEDLTCGYNSNLHFFYFIFWHYGADNVQQFFVAFEYEGEWYDIENPYLPDPTNKLISGRKIESLQAYWSTGAPPAGEHRFKVRAVNSYGSSIYTEPCSIVVY